MPIICKICNNHFEKIIPWQHLKTHGITSSEYKLQYGDIYSQEVLDKLAAKVPHNKGKAMSVEQKLILSEKAKSRNVAWKESGTNPNKGRVCSKETKNKIKAARAEQIITTESVLKAIATKTARGYDLATFRGKTHTDKTKEKIRNSTIVTNQQKSNSANAKILERATSINLSILNIDSQLLDITCNVCNSKFTFTKQYFHESKFKTTICPACNPRTKTVSKGETEIFKFVQSIFPDAIQSYRASYHTPEIDIFVPTLNIGFEFNGLYWHSEPILLANNQSKIRDYEKQQTFNSVGIRIIQIFEDEWKNKTNIVKSRISNILGVTPRKIYARQCIIKEISSSIAAEFCEQYHIMGKGRSNVRIGLFFKDELVSVMTFTKSNLSRKLVGWELNRFASITNTTVVGGASKLFSAFLRSENPSTIISYSDNRWSSGGVYKSLGFKCVNPGTPSYWYVRPNQLERFHRFGLRKNKNDDQTLSEYENRYNQGYMRIWDCGHAKWIWNKNPA